MKDFAIICLWVLGFYFGSVLIGKLYDKPNVTIYTDLSTGCEYLVSKDTGIFPRINSDGAHICKEPSK